MKNYFSFISQELPKDKQLTKGDFVAITLKSGQTVEGKLLSTNEDYLALEMFTGDKPLHEIEDVREFAEGNLGFVLDYSVFPTEEIISFTKYKKLETNINNG